ncbi:MAG: L,D-transpeptidase family protein [Novosphingobium sp.]
MKRLLCTMATLALTAGQAQAQGESATWSSAQIRQLRDWVAAAPKDALPLLSTSALDAAERSGDAAAVAGAATDLALREARQRLLGAASQAERAKWKIVDTDSSIDLPSRLSAALSSGSFDSFIASLDPRYPDYAVLRTAYATETDRTRKLTLARNMERWRWMPQAPGPDFVLVNAPAFEAEYWHDNQLVGTRRVIVGKPRTPTPVFSARITAVTLNPWWYVPASIVRESVGALVRRSPAAARARGYVWSGGQIRQRPGPGNALGVTKLEMPNPNTVYMHDTPDHSLFDRDVRAFSHGCIRTDDVVGLGAALLEGIKTRAEIDAIIATRINTTIDLPRPIPVYVAYFTASAGPNGTVRYHADLYGRDGAIRAAWLGRR